MSKIAVLIPCYNEELTVKKVINDFQKEVHDFCNPYILFYQKDE